MPEYGLAAARRRHRRPGRPARPRRAAARATSGRRATSRATGAATSSSSTFARRDSLTRAAAPAPPRRRARAPRRRRHAEQVADSIEEWFTNGAADGFNVMPPAMPARPRGLRRPRRADPAGARPVPHASTRAARCATTTACRSRRDPPRRWHTRADRHADQTQCSHAQRSSSGNPKPGSRTLAAAVHVARELGGGEPGLVADLATSARPCSTGRTPTSPTWSSGSAPPTWSWSPARRTRAPTPGCSSCSSTGSPPTGSAGSPYH